MARFTIAMPFRVTGMKTQKTFREKVLAVVRCIPRGSSMTYKQVAAKAGNSKAARAVGAIMKTNYDPVIPCHRVVGSDGTLRGYNRGGPTKKKALLKSEGAFQVATPAFRPGRYGTLVSNATNNQEAT